MKHEKGDGKQAWLLENITEVSGTLTSNPEVGKIIY